MKTCTKCGEDKDVENFCKDKLRKDGLHPYCKSCVKKYSKGYRKKNREEINEKNKEYYEKNREEINEKRREYYKGKGKEKKREYCKKNKDEILKKRKVYYEKNRDEFDKYNREYYKNNKEKLLGNVKEYYKENKDKIIEREKKHSESPASYKTYHNQLTIEESPRLAPNGVSLEVKCKYCGKYFVCSNGEVSNRRNCIKGHGTGEGALYCSDNCKKSCGTYGQKTWPKGHKTDTSREVQPALRKLVLERDNWTCQKCEATTDDHPLHCHHYEGIELNPTESADVDNCVTLCKPCHNKAHEDCDMRRKKCINP